MTQDLPGVLLVSIPKAGTHLLGSLLTKLGYLGHGWAKEQSPVEQAKLADQLKGLEQIRALSAAHPNVPFLPLCKFVGVEAEARVEPLSKQMRHALNLRHAPALALSLDALSNKQLFPANVFLNVHELWYDEYSSRFLEDWILTGQPRIIFNYRDPRDQIISMVHFLTDPSAPSGVLGKLFRPILQRFESFEERLSFAIRCPTFPFREIYRRNAWMLQHPGICKIRFEDIVGPQGGSTEKLQSECLERAIQFLGITADINAVAQTLFGGTKTFRQGRANAWKETFTESHQREFEREFGDVLQIYGYT
jgi:hypothetical protein